MPLSVTPLADAEALVHGWLLTQFAPIRVVTELPSDLATQVPLIQVTRFGGSDRSLVLDDANIDIDTYALASNAIGGASKRSAARLLAEQVRSALRLHLPGYAANGAAVTAVSTINAPRWVPYDNTDLRRFVASYRITIHSVPA